MKVIKSLAVILLLAVLGALAYIFWPKMRECCDRWLAGESCSGKTSAPDKTDALAEAAPAVDEP